MAFLLNDCMGKLGCLLLAIGIIFGCTEQKKSHSYNSIQIETVFEDSLSIRAIEFLDENTLAFAGSNGTYGTVDVKTGKLRSNIQVYDSIVPEFRAIAHTQTDFFMLSAGNPALLYKTGDNGIMELVYEEHGKGVFYDAMKFWNDEEGIAVGDTVDGCLSIIITRDGGKSWEKVSCANLPKGIEGEGAFAASNTNIEIKGDRTWVATTESRIYFSPDKGKNWQLQVVPIVNTSATEGVYSLDFYDPYVGMAFGGDYTNPVGSKANKALTTDGGKSWNIIADGDLPGYKSCVQFVPNAAGKDIVAIGFTGIAYSNDGGENWESLSQEGFYTIRFLNDSIAYAAGRNRIARLTFQ